MIINGNIFKINIAEAAAIYCMYSSLREHKLTEPGSKYIHLLIIFRQLNQ
jgi:hypothetical protein